MIVTFEYILNKEKRRAVDIKGLLEQMDELEHDYKSFYEDFDYKGSWEALKTILTKEAKIRN